MTRTLGLAATVFAASLAIDWPAFPFNARLAELFFVVVAALVAVHARPARPRLAVLDLLVLAYMAGALPSLLVTDDPRSSLIELLRHAYLLAMYAVVALLAARGYASSVSNGLALGGIALATVGLLFEVAHLVSSVSLPVIGERMRLPYVGNVLRLRALTFSPSMLGCLLTVAIGFAIAGALRASDAGHRRLWALGTALVFVAIGLTFSHTVSGFLVAALFMRWPLLAVRRTLRASVAAAVLLVVAALNLTAMASVRSVSLGGESVTDATNYPYAMGGGRLSLGPLRVDYEVMSYLRLKEIAVDTFLHRPWTGVGLDRFHQATEAAYQQGRLPPGYRAIDPHSSLLGRLAETGIVGGLTLVALWAGIVIAGARLLRSRLQDPWVARAAVAAVIGLLVNGINVDVMNFRFLWVSVGLIRGLGSPSDS